MTPEAGIAELRRRLAAVEVVPEQVITATHKKMLPMIPVYTGTYRDAVKFAVSDGGQQAMLYVSMRSMMDAQQTGQAELFDEGLGKAIDLDYISANIHGRPPEGPYPLRIETLGRPTNKSPSGKDLWDEVEDIVGIDIQERLLAASRGAI
jgi:hypothetical protein